MNIKKLIENFKDPKLRKFVICGLVIGFCMMAIIFNIVSQKIIQYDNKKLILKEPTKITKYTEFERLCKENKIETVYYNDRKDTILFSTKEGISINQIKYNHNYLKDIYMGEIFNYRYRKNPERYEDSVLLVYKSFNPKKYDFREFLLKNDIQVVGIEDTQIDYIRVFSTILYAALIVFMFKSMNIGKSDEEEELSKIPDVTFDDIEGNEEAKEEMKMIVDFLENPDKYNNMGAKIPRGVIFYGPPGTGKTLLAKAIAGEAKVPFFTKSASDFVEVYVGVGAKRVKTLFKKARKKAPCIIFIDEIDAIGGKRGVSKNDEKDQTLNKLLVELDGFKTNEGIVVIAATNRIDMLDNALIRSGRFDKHIPIELPTKKDRIGILKVHFKNKHLSEEVLLEDIAEVTAGFSGADIATLANESAIIASVKNKTCIEKDDIDEAYIKTAMKANLKKDLNKGKEETRIIAFHEAGHALVAKLLNKEVHKVSIIGTTNGAGGFTTTSDDDIHLLSKEDFEKNIKILLAGRAAEYVFFNGNEEKITMGASNDIERVTAILNSMIKKYGMVIKSKYTDNDGNNISMYAPYNLENSDSKISNDIGMLESTRLYNETIKLLKENEAILHDIANSVLDKETLSGKDIDEIIKNSEK